MRSLQHTSTQKEFTFKVAFLYRNITEKEKSNPHLTELWAYCRLQIFRPSLPWQLLAWFAAISHFIFPVLITLYYVIFLSLHTWEIFFFCLLSEAENYSWELWIKNYVLKTLYWKLSLNMYSALTITMRYTCNTFIHMQILSTHKCILSFAFDNQKL